MLYPGQSSRAGWSIHIAQTTLKELNEKWMVDWEKRKVMTVYHLNPEEQKAWLARVEPVQNLWAAEIKKKGFPARQIVDEFKKALQESSK